jgi:triacylglycerol esterase/lipase EstA (alpha/beta hydrolase family)
MRRIVPGLGISIAAAVALALTAVTSTPSLAASAGTTPSAALPGANDFSCRPTAAHTRPVVLAHGTFATMSTFVDVAPRLAHAGFCVFALNYGCQFGQQLFCATAPIEDSAKELSSFIDRVLAATGASQVDVVGHSQGGMMPRQYLKFLRGSARVHQLVGLAPSNHGTTLNGLANVLGILPGLAALCDACVEQLAGSTFLTNLNAGGDVLPGVQNTVIETRFDEVVTPYNSAFLTGPGVTNLVLQDSCPQDRTGHLGVISDPNAIGWVLHALDPTIPQPACVPFNFPL